jgi:hypothetical protein
MRLEETFRIDLSQGPISAEMVFCPGARFIMPDRA